MQDGQFNDGIRGNVLTTADLSVASNYVAGDASSTVRFVQLNGTTINNAEIQVIGYDASGFTVIPSGSSTPSCLLNTQVITTEIGASATYVGYTIQNTGPVALNLTGTPLVAISGDPAFTVAQQPAGTTILPNGQYDFGINFIPTTPGTHTATISIANDDSDENPYTFVVGGEAVTTMPQPALAIVGLASTNDQFSFVALRDFTPNEVFYFTDDTYDEETNAFEHVGGVESLFKYMPADTVFAGDVVVVTEGAIADQIVVTCTDQCNDTDVTFVDLPFSFATNDAFYCFTSLAVNTTAVDIFSNVDQIHSSLALSNNQDYTNHSCFHPTALHVKLTSVEGQFSIPLRETTTLTDYAAFQDPANYIPGTASSTIPFDRIVLGCGDDFYDTGGDSTAYTAYAMERYTFCPDVAGEVVTIDFSFVDMETSTSTGSNGTGCWDYLTIYNGDSNTAPLLGTFCGERDGSGSVSSMPSSHLEAGDQFRASNPSGCLTVTFQSDGSVQKEGFEALITCGPDTCTTNPIGDSMSTAILLTNNVSNQPYDLGCYNNTYSGASGSDIYFKYSAHLICVDSIYVSTCGTTTNINSIIYLLDANGSVIASNSDDQDVYGCSVLRAEITPGSEVYLVVDNQTTEIGQFEFTFYPYIRGNTLNNPRVAGSLPFSQIGTNHSLCSPGDNYNSNGFGGLDVFYQFTTGSCVDSIHISTCSDTTAFDTYITLLDANGNYLNHKDDSPSGTCNFTLNGINRFSILSDTVSPNTTYYVVVDGFDNTEFGTYELTIEESIVKNLPGNTDTTVINLPGNIYNQVYATTCMNNNYPGSAGNDMFFKISGKGICSDSVYISTCNDATNFDTYLYLIDDTGTVIANNDDALPGTCTHLLNGLNRFSTIRALLDAGKTYTLVVDGFNSTQKGTFGLTYYNYRHGNFMGDPILVPSLPFTETNNSACYSNIFDPQNIGANDVFYKFTTGPCADTINITTCSNTSFNTFLYLLNEDGTQKYNNNDFCGQQSRIRAAIAPNTTYFLVLDGFTQLDRGTYEVSIEDICRPGVMVSPKLFLEGAYESSTGLMRDDLRSQNILNFVEPFTGLGLTHINGGGGETSFLSTLTTTGNDAIVDWVFVELRDPVDPTVILATRSAFLQRDGDVVEHRYGVGPVEFTNLPDGDYYVAVRSRNHLAVCSVGSLTLSQTVVTPLDFTGGVAYGTSAMKSYSTGEYALWEGDINADGAINAADRSKAWNNRNTVGSYTQSDSNLDGACTAIERSNIWNNRNLTAQLP